MTKRLYHKSSGSAIPCCPRCGAESYRFYRDPLSKEIIGCADCLEKIDADDLAVEQEESAVWADVDAQIDRILERRAGL